MGNVTTFAYDAAGRLLETKLPDPATGATTAASPTTTNKYDLLGNLFETIDPLLHVSQFKYDKLGRVIQEQTLAGNSGNRTNPVPATVSTLVSLSTTEYDAVGNASRVAAYDVSQYNASTTPALAVTPLAVISPANILNNAVQVATMRYDAFGQYDHLGPRHGLPIRCGPSKISPRVPPFPLLMRPVRRRRTKGLAEALWLKSDPRSRSP